MKTLLIDWNCIRSDQIIWTVENDPIDIGERVLLWSGDEDDAMTCEGNVILCKPAPFNQFHSYIEIQLDKDSWYF